MRRLRLLLLLPLVLAGCGEGEPGATEPAPVADLTVNTDAFVTYRSEELGFSIGHPSDWEVRQQEGETLVTFSAPAGEDGLTTNFNVSVGEVPESIPVAAYHQGEVARLEANLGDIEVLEAADVDVDGVPGRGITLVTDQDGLRVAIARLIVLDAGRAWEVTFFTPASRLEEMAPLVREVFASFRFVG